MRLLLLRFLYNRWLVALLHGDDVFLTLPHPKVTAAQDGRAIDSYKAHNAGVRRRIPKRRLLELDLGSPKDAAGNPSASSSGPRRATAPTRVACPSRRPTRARRCAPKFR